MINRIIFLFCCLSLCFSQAEANEKQEISKILFQIKSQSLDSVLCQLEQQSRYRFFYTDKIKQGEKIYFTYSALQNLEKGKTVSEILDILLVKRGYSHFILDECKTVIIYKKEIEIPKITIRFENLSLDSALIQLEHQAGYQFVYHDKIADKLVKLNQVFENKTVSEILDVLFANTDYSYVVLGKNNQRVILYKQKSASLSVNGTVVNEEGKAILAASVYIKGEDNETLTDESGQFTITTTNPNACIIVLYLGYLPRVVHVGDAGLIKLEPDEKI